MRLYTEQDLRDVYGASDVELLPNFWPAVFNGCRWIVRDRVTPAVVLAYADLPGATDRVIGDAHYPLVEAQLSERSEVVAVCGHQHAAHYQRGRLGSLCGPGYVASGCSMTMLLHSREPTIQQLAALRSAA